MFVYVQKQERAEKNPFFSHSQHIFFSSFLLALFIHTYIYIIYIRCLSVCERLFPPNIHCLRRSQCFLSASNVTHSIHICIYVYICSTHMHIYSFHHCNNNIIIIIILFFYLYLSIYILHTYK